MDDLREAVAKIVAEADFDGDAPWESCIHKDAFRALADRIIAIIPRTCDLCDQPASTLRCNECAQIMASDY